MEHLAFVGQDNNGIALVVEMSAGVGLRSLLYHKNYDKFKTSTFVVLMKDIIEGSNVVSPCH